MYVYIYVYMFICLYVYVYMGIIYVDIIIFYYDMLIQGRRGALVFAKYPVVRRSALFANVVFRSPRTSAIRRAALTTVMAPGSLFPLALA